MRDHRDIIDGVAQRVYDASVDRHNDYVKSSARGFTALAPTRAYWHQLSEYDREWQRKNIENIVEETLKLSGWFEQQ